MANRDSKRRRHDDLDRSDRLTANLRVVTAILDCTKVLSALERAPVNREIGELLTGDGFAAGHQLRGGSLPDLLAHGLDLVRQIEQDADAFAEQAMSSASQPAEGGSHATH
jgi:hypothetical protein